MKSQQNSLFNVDALVTQVHQHTANERLTPQTKKMLKLMTEWGLNKDVTAAMLEIAELAPAHIQYIAGPVITYKSDWSADIPPWLFNAIAIDRLDACFSEHDTGTVGELATTSEVLTYMMPATLDFPIHPDWVNVYLWAGNEALTKHNRLPDGATFWHLMGKTNPPTYDQIKGDCERLAREIRSSVVKAARDRGWGKRTKTPKPPATTPEPKRTPQPEIIQISLF